MKSRTAIRAAGGLVWRDPLKRDHLLVIHRPRYDDWTLPKGKLEAGESWHEAALREVKEETGYEVRMLSFAGAVSYLVDDQPKVVCYWHMALNSGRQAAFDDDEVQEVIWLSREEALERLDYPLEAALLESLTSEVNEMTQANAWSRFWRGVSRLLSNSDERLKIEMNTFGNQWAGLLKQYDEVSPGANPWWKQFGNELQLSAREALEKGAYDIAWSSLKEAYRNEVNALAALQALNKGDISTAAGKALEAKVEGILREAKDKPLSKWREEAINEILSDKGKPKANMSASELIQAMRYMDGHHDNVYFKLGLFNRRLIELGIVSLLATYLLWFVFLPNMATVEALKLLQERNFAAAVISLGVLGALVSGLLSASRGVGQRKIPDQLFGRSVTFTRLIIGGTVAPILVTFLASGLILNLGQVTPQLMLAVAFVSGFSERLVRQAVQTVTDEKEQKGEQAT